MKIKDVQEKLRENIASLKNTVAESKLAKAEQQACHYIASHIEHKINELTTYHNQNEKLEESAVKEGSNATHT